MVPGPLSPARYPRSGSGRNDYAQVALRWVSVVAEGRARVRSTILVLVLALLSGCGGGGSNSSAPGYENVDGVQVVVSAHSLATDAGIAILEAGGSAADAAVAVAAMLTVVEPWFSSVLGGGTWGLYHDASDGRVTSLDGVGPVGSKASVADYSSRYFQAGMHQAVVPGAWDGWMLWLDHYGRLSLGEILKPAIAVARDGFPASDAMVQWLRREASLVAGRPDTAKIYAPGGTLIQPGDTVYQRDLAATLESLVEAFDAARWQGRGAAIQAARDHFYRGPLAEAIVGFSESFGGYLTREDFRAFAAEIVEPIAIDYRDELTVFQNPPNSQGITMLIALNILKGLDFSRMQPDDADAVHLQVEALKLAFADRHYHVGDPERIEVPVEALLSDAHAERQRERIDLSNVLLWPIEDALVRDARSAAVRVDPLADLPEDPVTGTTTFHVLDREGNAAAVTTSLGAQFLVIGDTGIHINNRMRFLALADNDPNRLTPGYKVRHTSNPYLVLRSGSPYILGGNTGADTQAQGQVQQFISHVEFGLSAQQAVNQPRFLTTAFPATISPFAVGNTLQMETGFPETLPDQLRARGHLVQEGFGLFGVAGMVVIDPDQKRAEIGTDSRYATAAGRIIPATSD